MKAVEVVCIHLVPDFAENYGNLVCPLLATRKWLLSVWTP
jgi:hypothetical protein